MNIPGLWLRGKTYWLAATLPGWGRVRLSLETSDLAEAIRKSRLIRAAPEHYIGAKPDQSLIGQYMAHQERRGVGPRWREDAAATLAKLADGKPLERISPTALHRWIDGLLKTRKPKTLKIYVSYVSGFFRWAIDQGKMQPPSPLANIILPRIAPKPRRSFLTPEQARLVLDECVDSDLKFALYCGLHAGLRKGEIIAARPRWFDLSARLLHVQTEVDWHAKDRDNRTIPLTDEFCAFLRGYGIRSPYMFRPNVQPTGRYRYRTDFRKQFDGHMARLGLAEFTFHDLRRTFASLHASHGTSPYSVAKWMSIDMETFQNHYGHLLPHDSRINGPWST